MELNKIVKAIEQEKRRADSEFRKSIGLEADSVEAMRLDMEIVYPRQERLDEISNLLKDHPPDKIMEELKNKKGQIYDLLLERAKIARLNYENRYEIAKLSAMLLRLKDEERADVVSAIRHGSFEEPIKLSIDKKEIEELSRYMMRCGITCSADEGALIPEEGEESEVSATIENRKVWICSEDSEKLKQNLKRINELGSQLQVRNAKRHIMTFNEQEEKKYNELQEEFLALLKEQDELLKDYYSEMS